MTTKSLFEALEKQYGKLTFGELIKAWRECEEMTQSTFAKKINISPQNLNDIEKGRKIPSPARAARIAKKLGLPQISLIQLAIQDSLAKEGFDYEISLKSA
jgi:transcriptional regulator with XRE-family HTH domain